MNDIIYHGKNRRNFFEGWYYKLEDRNGDNAFALIPGIVKGSREHSHSFVQLLNREGTAHYFTYPFSAFNAKDRPFNVSIGNSEFTLNHMHIDIKQDMRIKADLEISNLQRWPQSIYAPGVMGPFSYIPFMQCNHGIISMHHDINGFIEIEGKRIDMNSGRGYMEKDWGSAFPSQWIWLQCNRFDTEGVSIFVSIAHIPVGEFAFEGLIACLLHENRFIRFATYYCSQYSIEALKRDFVHIKLKNRQFILDVKAYKSKGADLPSPKPGQMSSHVNETINGRIELLLQQGSNTVMKTTGFNAGIEIHMPPAAKP